jgi:hypothetical protein
MRTIIKEISDIAAMKLDINRDMVSYVVISRHLLSFVKVGGNHTLLSDYLLRSLYIYYDGRTTNICKYIFSFYCKKR